MRVMIADDDRVLVQMLGAEFQKRGWEVARAFDAMQAVMFATRSPQPDVVVLDLGMPGGTGFGVLEKLGRSALTTAIPVFVITGSSGDEAPVKAREMGAVAFFRKPIEPGPLIDEVEAYMEDRGSSER